MSQIKLPDTIRAASKQLTKLDGLVTARQWERAAIVYAFTEPQQGRRTSVSSDGSLTIEGFAQLGVAGLRSHNTVSIYRNAWQAAMDAGKATGVKPGDRVDVPDMDWPPTDPRTGHYEDRAIRTIRNQPELVDELMKDPVVRRAASRATDDHYRQQAADRANRTERKTAEDPTSRGIDSAEAINDLGTAAERFSREGNEALRRVGPLPDGERYWLTGAIDRAEQTVRAARRYLETGVSEIDAELAAIVDGG